MSSFARMSQQAPHSQSRVLQWAYHISKKTVVKALGLLMKKRSDTSKRLRQDLKSNYVVGSLPAIGKGGLLFGKYAQYAKNMFKEGGVYKSRNDYLNSLPEYSSDVNWLKRASDVAFIELEHVVEALDADEDRRIEENLIDAFDGFDGDMEMPKPSVRSTVHEEKVEDIENAIVATHSEERSMDLPRALALLRNGESKGEESGISSDGLHLELTSTTPGNLSILYNIDEGKAPLHSVSAVFDTEDYALFSFLQGYTEKFPIPTPYQSPMSLTLPGGKVYNFVKDDLHVSFSPFLRGLPLPTEFQMADSVIETNRCFFIHLGVAMGLHPLSLRLCFRHWALKRIERATSDDPATEILQSVLIYAGFVDANSLCFIWPNEFRSSRICIISGLPGKQQIFSCFSSKGAQLNLLRDVIIHCDDSHFTLLRPAYALGGFSILSTLLRDAKAAGCVVQENEVEEADISVLALVKSLA